MGSNPIHNIEKKYVYLTNDKQIKSSKYIYLSFLHDLYEYIKY